MLARQVLPRHVCPRAAAAGRLPLQVERRRAFVIAHAHDESVRRASRERDRRRRSTVGGGVDSVRGAGQRAGEAQVGAVVAAQPELLFFLVDGWIK